MEYAMLVGLRMDPQVVPHDLRSMVATELEETPKPQTHPLATRFEELKIRYDELFEENVFLMMERDAIGLKLLEVKAERNLARQEMHRGWADATDSRRALTMAQRRIKELEDQVVRLGAQIGTTDRATE